MAKSFVKFNGTKLILENEELSESVRVLSILGKARMGKSTFLNAITSKILNVNTSAFKCQTGIEHCTYGIDYYYIKEKNILLLDSQGLANGDASHDPSLLLFIYLVSDLIIFNDSKILQNEALKLMEPICAFMTYIEDMDVKPHLMFRISDGELIDNPAKNLSNVLAPHEDQYQSIRDSLNELFHRPIQLVKTETLERIDKSLIDEGDYLRLLAIKGNGFERTVNEILDYLTSLTPKPSINLPKIVEQINNNEKITIDKLDVVGLLAENEVLAWINDIDPLFDKSITVDGTQASYEKNVLPRIELIKKKITQYKRRFNKISKSITGANLVKLEKSLYEPVVLAQAESHRLALDIIKPQAKFLDTDYSLRPLTNEKESFSIRSKASLRSTYLSQFTELYYACQPLYEKVKTHYLGIIENINEAFFKAVQEEKEEEKEEKRKISEYYANLLETSEPWSKVCISELNNKDLMVTNEEIINRWIDDLIEKAMLFTKISKKGIQAKFSSSRLAITHTGTGFITNPTKYDLVADIYNAFVLNLTGLELWKTINPLIREQKEKLMFNKVFLNQPLCLCEINRDIEFVYDPALLECVIKNQNDSQTVYMTKRTWIAVYEPLYITAIHNLVEKGLCKNTCTYNDFMISVRKENITAIIRNEEHYDNYTIYEKNIYEMIIRQMKKIYCCGIVQGQVFPEIYDLEEDMAPAIPTLNNDKPAIRRETVLRM